MVCATAANCSLGKDGDPLEPRDFFPGLPEPEPQEADPEQLVAMFRAWAGAKVSEN